MAATINATLKQRNSQQLCDVGRGRMRILKPSQAQQHLGQQDKTTNKNRASDLQLQAGSTRLNFYGDRCDTGQALSWPRNNYHVDRVELDLLVPIPQTQLKRLHI